jgi:hypothetical protein
MSIETFELLTGPFSQRFGEPKADYLANIEIISQIWAAHLLDVCLTKGWKPHEIVGDLTNLSVLATAMLEMPE